MRRWHLPSQPKPFLPFLKLPGRAYVILLQHTYQAASTLLIQLPPPSRPSLHRNFTGLASVGLRQRTAMMTTETPRLDTIAPELLQTILSFISGPDTSGGGTVDVQISRVRSLHALTMASKQLRYETLPFLYRRFESWNDISLPLFARSLCENHELAKCLQFFYVSVSETQIQRPTEGTSRLSRPLLIL